VAERYRGKE